MNVVFVDNDGDSSESHQIQRTGLCCRLPSPVPVHGAPRVRPALGARSRRRPPAWRRRTLTTARSPQLSRPCGHRDRIWPASCRSGPATSRRIRARSLRSCPTPRRAWPSRRPTTRWPGGGSRSRPPRSRPIIGRMGSSRPGLARPGHPFGSCECSSWTPCGIGCCGRLRARSGTSRVRRQHRVRHRTHARRRLHPGLADRAEGRRSARDPAATVGEADRVGSGLDEGPAAVP